MQPRISAQQAGGQNRLAFLHMITVSELSQPIIAGSDDGYNILVGSTPSHIVTFPSYADHPMIQVPGMNSNAAGAYQIMGHFWPYYKKLLNLPDFGPVSQDLYALQQIKESKALALVDGGYFQAAVNACGRIWASLPGSPYGQHIQPLDMLQQVYVNAGGTLAS